MSDALWSAVCLAGVWGFVFCTVMLILKGFTARGCFERAGALRWGAALLVCFTIWIIGMTKA